MAVTSHLVQRQIWLSSGATELGGGVEPFKWFSAVLKNGRCVFLKNVMTVVLGGRCVPSLDSDLIDMG